MIGYSNAAEADEIEKGTSSLKVLSPQFVQLTPVPLVTHLLSAFLPILMPHDRRFLSH